MLENNRVTVQRISMNVPGFTADMKLALKLFTASLPHPLYQYINHPYQQMIRTRKSVFNTLGIIKILIAAIRHLSHNENYVYRGDAYRVVTCADDPAFRTKWLKSRRLFCYW
jgi:Na+(H+)/acetate symporter ActP